MNFSSFTFEQEPAYEKFMHAYNRQTTRWSCVIGILFCLGLITFLNADDFLSSFSVIAVLSIFALTLGFTIFKSNKRDLSATTLTFLSMSVCALYMVVCFAIDYAFIMPVYFLPNFLMTGLLISNTIISFQLSYKLIGTTVVFLSYVVYAVTASTHPVFHTSQILNLFLSVIAVGWISFLMDRFKRMNFLKRQEMHELRQYLSIQESNAGVGSWNWNLVEAKIQLTKEAKRIFEAESSIVNGNLTTVIEQRIHPDDAERVRSEVEAVSLHGGVLVTKYRLLLSGTSVKYILARGVAYQDLNGRIAGVRGTVHDITELELVTSSLKTTRERLQRVITSSHEGVWEMDLVNEQVVFSDRWKELFGYSDEELQHLRLNWKKFIHPHDIEKFYNAVHEQATGKSLFCFEYRLKHKDGNYRWTRLSCYVATDNAGRATKLTGWNEDITDRKDVEQKLVESESHLRTILQTEPECVKLLNRRGDLLDMNQAGLEMIEAESLDQVKGKPVWSLVDDDFKSAFNRLNRQVFDGTPGKLEFKIRGLKGTQRWLETNAVPLKDSMGNVTALLGVTRDITTRKIAEENLRESEIRFRTMADYAPVLIWMSGPDKLCHYFNKGWLAFVGRTIEQELGNGWVENVHRDDLQRCVNIYESNFDERKEFKMEYRLRRHDGEYRWIVDNGIPRFLPNGEFVGYIGSCIDIHDIKESESALLVSNREKDALIKEIHHRIKNNLQLISSIVFIKMSVMDDGEDRRFLSSMRQRIRSIAHIHERLLQTGSIDKVNIADYFQQLLDDLIASLSIQEADVAVESNVQGVLVSPDTAIYCGLIANEMITNAFKHGFRERQHGIIRVSFIRDNDWYKLAVFNDGSPLPAEIDPVTSGSFGMQLMNVFINQLKGKLTINRHNGTEFTVIIPII